MRRIVPRSAPKVTLSCVGCGTDFTILVSAAWGSASKTPQRYCTLECYRRNKGVAPVLVCHGCGKEFEGSRYPSGAFNRTRKYCSEACENVTRREKAFIIDKYGYKLLRADGGYIPEHRAVVERQLGRQLFADETVHHKNGDRADNRPENLELWSSRHGKGQRVEDRIAFMRTFLRDYGFAVLPAGPSSKGEVNVSRKTELLQSFL